MATDTLIGGIAPDTILDDKCQVVAEAINPTTGAAVGGVLVSNFFLYVDDHNTTPIADTVPLLTPLELSAGSG